MGKQQFAKPPRKIWKKRQYNIFGGKGRSKGRRDIWVKETKNKQAAYIFFSSAKAVYLIFKDWPKQVKAQLF